jgi:hypothetical protein
VDPAPDRDRGRDLGQVARTFPFTDAGALRASPSPAGFAGKVVLLLDAAG